MKSFVERIQQSESNCSRAPEVKVKGNNITIPAGKIMHVNYKPNVRLVKKEREQCFSKETWLNWNTLSPKRIMKKILCFWFRQDFAKKLFKRGTILESSPSPNWKWKHKFSKLISGTLQVALSPQSSPISSSYLPQSSLIRSPPPSSLSRLNFLSVQTLYQSSLPQSLSATVTSFNPKCLFCLFLQLLHQNYKY